MARLTTHNLSLL